MKNNFGKFSGQKSNAQKKEEFRQEKKKVRAERDAYFEKKRMTNKAEDKPARARFSISKQTENTAKSTTASSTDQMPLNKYLAHCAEDADKKLLQNILPNSQDALIAIGPEGDFTTDEVSLSQSQGFQPVSLGESRLRAETAGIIVCAQFQSLWQLNTP